MKRLILILAVIASSVAIQAQEHLTFEGIAIDGNSQDFGEQMKAAGYAELVPGDYSMFLGNVIGENVIISTYATPITDIVYAVGLMFQPKSQKWKRVKEKYEEVRDAYASVYGKPIEVIDLGEEFSGKEIAAIYSGLVSYACYFSVNGGEIRISIGAEDYDSDVAVYVGYVDQQNDMINEKEYSEHLDFIQGSETEEPVYEQK
ncbi:MAG: hypothetical protein HUK15_06060 [Bacteroidales bacterium]|nr:hypothetical protein [Bacteroidales bacterium]